ncbi:class I SAM-dependent methyltransferase [uncultured Paludibaculum sp.]|uniref:class I SAM-dependent methyltransferase n=1 Tax=uncultured Paludibaculum sp. TaxID=1765020 RepID=UPI002AAB1D3E|nr:class I SAM-dependent methyltransferase [uncultured Paludibaculum sp.]
MALLEPWMRRLRARYLLDRIPADARVLEVGSGSGWAGGYLRTKGVKAYTGMDLHGPADVVGDILQWPSLGLQAGSFDVIVAFEILEHVDCFEACRQLLKRDGLLILTTPAPEWDWLLKILENLGINQRRTSPHSNLFDARRVPGFRVASYRRFAGLAQWAVLRNEPAE